MEKTIAFRGMVYDLLHNYPVEALMEMEKDPVFIWLSFSDEEEFRGVVVVYAHGILEAVRVCKEQNICPGQEVLAQLIPSELVPPEKYRHRILLDEEARAAMPNADVERIMVGQEQKTEPSEKSKTLPD